MKETYQKNSALGLAWQAVTVTVMLLLICGIGFPLLLTGLAAVLFPEQAQGSLVYADGKAVGSILVGQDFTEDYFLKCRPSAYHYNTYRETENGDRFYSDGTEYAGLGSGSDNYGPSNPALAARVEKDIQNFHAENPDVTAEQIPADLITASGSGLDPHISPQAAAIQLSAVSESSGIPRESLEAMVAKHTTGKLLGIFGEETVNVLAVNLEIATEIGLIHTVHVG